MTTEAKKGDFITPKILKSTYLFTINTTPIAEKATAADAMATPLKP